MEISFPDPHSSLPTHGMSREGGWKGRAFMCGFINCVARVPYWNHSSPGAAGCCARRNQQDTNGKTSRCGRSKTSSRSEPHMSKRRTSANSKRHLRRRRTTGRVEHAGEAGISGDRHEASKCCLQGARAVLLQGRILSQVSCKEGQRLLQIGAVRPHEATSSSYGTYV